MKNRVRAKNEEKLAALKIELESLAPAHDAAEGREKGRLNARMSWVRAEIQTLEHLLSAKDDRKL